MGNMEEWARKWLENQRHEGQITMSIVQPIVIYDREIKKGRKVSKYLGKWVELI